MYFTAHIRLNDYCDDYAHFFLRDENNSFKSTIRVLETPILAIKLNFLYLD
jgi:hypothetical protein